MHSYGRHRPPPLQPLQRFGSYFTLTIQLLLRNAARSLLQLVVACEMPPLLDRRSFFIGRTSGSPSLWRKSLRRGAVFGFFPYLVYVPTAWMQSHGSYEHAMPIVHPVLDPHLGAQIFPLLSWLVKPYKGAKPH